MGALARFNLTPFRGLIVGLSTSFSGVSSQSGSTIVLVAFSCNISAVSNVPMARLVDTMPACNV